MSDKKTFGFTTTILHNDRQKPIEQGSLHKPVHTSVAFGYNDARQLASVFENAPVAIAVLRGPELVYEFANPSYRALVGGRRTVVPIDKIPQVLKQATIATDASRGKPCCRMLRMSCGSIQLLVGPASSLRSEQMKVRSSTRATSLGSDHARYELGRFAGASLRTLPMSTSS